MCAVCHAFEEGSGNKTGPSLWNIVNRAIAADQRFSYSAALAQKQGVWDFDTLDRFLASPTDFAPGTRMALAGIEDENARASILRFLNTLSENPIDTDESVEKTVLADPFGPSWPQGQGRELTGHTCNACHSLAIVKQQDQTRSGWDELIDWMIEEQGMADLAAGDRAMILNYLAEHF